MFIWYVFFPLGPLHWSSRIGKLTIYSILQTKNGRISMAGLNTHNLDYFAVAVDSVVRETS